ncbi:MAG TPA: acyltransferase [Rhizomicrobium sp.]|nr:acyltransferase [Rhizomicrobium sp.]
MGSYWNSLRRGTRRLYTIAYAALVGAQVGESVVVMRGAVLNREHGGTIDIGPGTVIHPGAMLLPYGGFIRMGRRCSVNPYSVLYGHGGLVIGDHVRIAAHCVIVPANHGIALDGGLIADQPLSKRGVKIGNDVWIGAGARILDGTVIGDGCVVAAGAVVRGTLEPDGIYAGVPARLVRRRSATTTYIKSKKHETDRTEAAPVVATS